MAKYRANAQEPFKILKIKALDSMPVGTIVDYDGTSANVPVGWEAVSDNYFSYNVLWEGSASTMSGTTLSLDLTPYKYIEIIFYTETATSNWMYLKSTGKLKVLSNTTLTLGDYIAPNDNSQAPQFFGRNMTINNTKTSIIVGSGFNVSGSTYTTRNSSGVPIEIIGYK